MYLKFDKVKKDIERCTRKPIDSMYIRVGGKNYNMDQAIKLKPSSYKTKILINYMDGTSDEWNKRLEMYKEQDYTMRFDFDDWKDRFKNMFLNIYFWIALVVGSIISIFLPLIGLVIAIAGMLFSQQLGSKYVYKRKGSESLKLYVY